MMGKSCLESPVGIIARSITPCLTPLRAGQPISYLSLHLISPACFPLSTVIFISTSSPIFLRSHSQHLHPSLQSHLHPQRFSPPSLYVSPNPLSFPILAISSNLTIPSPHLFYFLLPTPPSPIISIISYLLRYLHPHSLNFTPSTRFLHLLHLLLPSLLSPSSLHLPKPLHLRKEVTVMADWA